MSTIKKPRFCAYCDRNVMAERPMGMSDGFGCLLIVLTGGLFLPVFLLLRIINAFHSFRCPSCGGVAGGGREIAPDSRRHARVISSRSLPNHLRPEAIDLIPEERLTLSLRVERFRKAQREAMMMAATYWAAVLRWWHGLTPRKKDEYKFCGLILLIIGFIAIPVFRRIMS